MSTRGWETVTPDQLSRATTEPRRKYRNTKTEVGGLTFDSRAEAEYWLVLQDRAARHEIEDLRRQVPLPLWTAVASHDTWLRVAVAHYVADFIYWEAGVRHVVDVKRPATRTAIYLLKRKWLQLQDGIVIEEVSG